MHALRVAFIWLAVLAAGVGHAAEITLRMIGGPSWGIPPKEAADPRSLARRAVFEEFHRRNPGIRVVNSGGLEVRTGESTFLMAMAGDTAPDVFYVNFRQLFNFVDQGFCMPLNGLIERGGGRAIARLEPVILDVLRKVDGKTIYAIPFFQVANALYFRKDHFLEAGLDPNRPPRTWEEFYAAAKRLTDSKPGRTGFAFSRGPGYHWTNFVWQAGGEVLEPAENGAVRAAIATPQGATALEFYRKLVAEKWIGPDGRERGPAAVVTQTFKEDVSAGKVSMWFTYTGDVQLSLSDVNPALLGIAQMPAGPGGRANEVNAGMWAINATLRDPAKIDAAWRFIEFFASEEAAKIVARKYVELGMGSLVNPVWLKRFGYADLAATVDPNFVRANERLFETGRPEPHGRNVQQVYMVLDGALDRAVLEPNTPAIDILRDTAREMDRKLLGYTPADELRVQRAWALGVAIAIGTAALALLAWAWAVARRRARASDEPKGRFAPFVAWCLAPASLSLLVWAYYPLVKGLVIAFQDYRIVQGASWVGLDNFIAVFTSPIFYRAVLNSFLYVGLSIVIGFLIPIFLALALNEIPRAKAFFRTLFYLPAMTSPMIVALLWRQFYDKGEQGLLNSFINGFAAPLNWAASLVGSAPLPKAEFDWLGNPTLAMFAVVLPGIWAGAGPGSILYLAALKNIPDERYEAADLDGAGWWQKIVRITVPALRPLILINLLGVFIAGFKAMENVFVLTGGGPLYSTHTLGLEVWTNAFLFLKFGYATAAAWVMGAILIGFTVIQVRSLTKMKFGAAKF